MSHLSLVTFLTFRYVPVIPRIDPYHGPDISSLLNQTVTIGLGIDLGSIEPFLWPQPTFEIPSFTPQPLLPLCNIKGEIKFQVNGLAEGKYRNFYTEIVTAETGVPVAPSEQRVLNITNGTTVNMDVLDYYVNYKMLVYSGNDITDKGDLLYTSQQFSCCDSEVVISLPADLFATPITINGSLKCNRGEIKPTLHIKYRLAGTTEWKYLGLLSKGSITFDSSQIQVGTAYDFTTTFNGRDCKVTNYTIQSIPNVIEFPLDNQTCNSLFGN